MNSKDRKLAVAITGIIGLSTAAVVTGNVAVFWALILLMWLLDYID